jgi:hypothetical protein
MGAAWGAGSAARGVNSNPASAGAAQTIMPVQRRVPSFVIINALISCKNPKIEKGAQKGKISQPKSTIFFL